MMRTILHSDMNNCYASIELLYHPELRGRPLAVGGDPGARHGIVLAKDQLAKKAGVKTGMALWQARQVCPDILFVPPHMDRYLRFSALAHEIYGEYTDRQEAFGIDESWLDVTACAACKGGGEQIAQKIRERIRFELGVTVSIGVSWNKIFAKFGSDYRKPDAVTVIDRENFRDIVWPQPVENLLYVGRSTKRRMSGYGIRTIGELAQTDPEALYRWFGKMGHVLFLFANGEDRTPVNHESETVPVKSIGNGMTTPRDLTCIEDIRIAVYVLAESVAARLREHGFLCRTVELAIRDNELYSFTRQMKTGRPTDLTAEIAEYGIRLFQENYRWQKPIRSLRLRAGDLIGTAVPVQLDLFTDERKREKLHRMDTTVDGIRRRFGANSIRRGLLYTDLLLSGINAKEEHIVHPHSYFESGNRTGAERYPFAKAGERRA